MTAFGDTARTTAFDELVDAFTAAHWAFHPVDASFAGETAHDGLLPPAAASAPARQRALLHELAARLERSAVPDSAGARIDARLMRAQLAHAGDALAHQPRFRNPAWYTGEVAFGLIALLLRPPGEPERVALRARLAAIPDFLAAGRAHLADAAAPADWVRRARIEVAALQRLLDALASAGAADGSLDVAEATATLAGARTALAEFDAAIAAFPDADPACGEARLARLIRDVHALDETPRALERRAAAAFAALTAELEERAHALDPNRGWREQLDRLATIGPAADDVLPSYARWHARALHDAAPLVTPAADYGLTFTYLPGWARAVAADLYFLSYRSPAARMPGGGSTYWVWPPDGDAAAVRRAHNTAAVKLVHAVHHGSIGHHTQNARARSSPSRLARIAGTDCASGIAFLAAGTMVEGWACYAEDLLAEVPGFYTAAEELQLIHFTLRNAASCLADIRLHLGDWSLDDMRRFYRDEVHFAPARIWAETTRNSMFPASRLMYWTGTERIKELRARSPLDARAFHDALLGFGSAPVAAIADELAR